MSPLSNAYLPRIHVNGIQQGLVLTKTSSNSSDGADDLPDSLDLSLRSSCHDKEDRVDDIESGDRIAPPLQFVADAAGAEADAGNAKADSSESSKSAWLEKFCAQNIRFTISSAYATKYVFL